MARAPARAVFASAGRFSVDMGAGAASPFDISQVVLSRLPAGKQGGTAGPLELRRIASADRQFHDWWAAALAGTAKARTITVSLLRPDNGAPLFAWRFVNARPIALSYGPLDGATDLPLEEWLEIAFDRMERV